MIDLRNEIRNLLEKHWLGAPGESEEEEVEEKEEEEEENQESGDHEDSDPPPENLPNLLFRQLSLEAKEGGISEATKNTIKTELQTGQSHIRVSLSLEHFLPSPLTVFFASTVFLLLPSHPHSPGTPHQALSG